MKNRYYVIIIVLALVILIPIFIYYNTDAVISRSGFTIVDKNCPQNWLPTIQGSTSKVVNVGLDQLETIAKKNNVTVLYKFLPQQSYNQSEALFIYSFTTKDTCYYNPWYSAEQITGIPELSLSIILIWFVSAVVIILVTLVILNYMRNHQQLTSSCTTEHK